jgi:hypothetical protein
MTCPPGWLAPQPDTSYTLPLMISQQSSGVQWRATSAAEYDALGFLLPTRRFRVSCWGAAASGCALRPTAHAPLRQQVVEDSARSRRSAVHGERRAARGGESDVPRSAPDPTAAALRRGPTAHPERSLRVDVGPSPPRPCARRECSGVSWRRAAGSGENGAPWRELRAPRRLAPATCVPRRPRERRKEGAARVIGAASRESMRFDGHRFARPGRIARLSSRRRSATRQPACAACVPAASGVARLSEQPRLLTLRRDGRRGARAATRAARQRPVDRRWPASALRQPVRSGRRGCSPVLPWRADGIVAPRRARLPPAPRVAARPLAPRLASSALRATQPSVGASVVGVASLAVPPTESATAGQDAETPAAPPPASGAWAVASLPRGGAAAAPIAARSRRRLGLIP